MSDEEFKQSAIQNNVGMLRSDLQRIQDRSGTMVAVIATILGIGLPLIAQSQTKQYFHVLPFILLIIAFILFYMAFIRGTTVVTAKKINITTNLGEKRIIPVYEAYKPNLYERLISFQLSLDFKEPVDICSRLEKLILVRTAVSQWGHAFFLAAIAVEAEEVVFISHLGKNKLIHISFAIIMILFVKFVFLFKLKGEQTF